MNIIWVCLSIIGLALYGYGWCIERLQEARLEEEEAMDEYFARTVERIRVQKHEQGTKVEQVYTTTKD